MARMEAALADPDPWRGREVGELAFVADQHRQRVQPGERVHQSGRVAADAVVPPWGDVAAVDYEPHTNSAIARATAAGAS